MTAATGGMESTIDVDGIDYRVHIFESSGTLVVTDGGDIEYLIIAGGGSGGGRRAANRLGGGGGAGGLLQGSLTISNGSESIIVGTGGSNLTESNGTDSVAFGLTAVGGGAGSRNRLGDTFSGNDGGSGGGRSGRDSSDGSVAGVGIPGQGHNGGGGDTNNAGTRDGGGGGGAGGVGGNGSAGAGLDLSITGTALTYSPGGPPTRGLPFNRAEYGAGGVGGSNQTYEGAAGRGGSGADGVVIFRYPITATAPNATPCNQTGALPI